MIYIAMDRFIGGTFFYFILLLFFSLQNFVTNDE